MSEVCLEGGRRLFRFKALSIQSVREIQGTKLAAGGTTVEKNCILKDSRIYSVGGLGLRLAKGMEGKHMMRS